MFSYPFYYYLITGKVKGYGLMDRMVQCPQKVQIFEI